MPWQDTYLLSIWRSRAVSGQHWVAHLDHLLGGESLRFCDQETLLAHLQAIVRDGDESARAASGPSEPARRAGADTDAPMDIDMGDGAGGAYIGEQVLLITGNTEVAHLAVTRDLIKGVGINRIVAGADWRACKTVAGADQRIKERAQESLTGGGGKRL